MSGHNKWAQIKHKKAASDAKRSKVFSKLARLIAVESKIVGGNVDSPNLRSAIERAKAVSMPKENIERAVTKGKSDTGVAMEAITYECYGPGGVAMLIDTLTDSRNRTNQELKHLLSLNDIALAAPGSAAWAFSKLPDGTWQPNSTIDLTDEDLAKLETLVDALEDRDDVESVVTNAA